MSKSRLWYFECAMIMSTNGETPRKTEENVMKESKQNNTSVAVRVIFEGLYIASLVFTVIWAACLG